MGYADVAANRVRLLYFGEANPARDNNTAAGRALDRRVEYSLFEIGKLKVVQLSGLTIKKSMLW